MSSRATIWPKEGATEADEARAISQVVLIAGGLPGTKPCPTIEEGTQKCRSRRQEGESEQMLAGRNSQALTRRFTVFDMCSCAQSEKHALKSPVGAPVFPREEDGTARRT